MNKNKAKHSRIKVSGKKQLTETRRTQHPKASVRNRPQNTTSGLKIKSSNGFFLFGRNSVEAALKNPERECVALYVTEKTAKDRQLSSLINTVETHIVHDTSLFTNSIPEGAPHQGVLLEVRPLPNRHLDEFEPIADRKNILLMLDQVTDPHNVGACIRSAAAFGARAIITQDRHSPAESGTLARSAAGGLEVLPWIRVANLSDALLKLRDSGYWHIGMDGNTDLSIRQVQLGDNIVIVMGSEGGGLRPLVKRNCDAIARIPIQGTVESLNVSNAAAVAMYEITS